MSKPTHRILIIDDNPFPTRECCCVLINKFCERLNISEKDRTIQLNKLFAFYYSNYEDLITNYSNIKGNDETFVFGNQVHLTIYNYNPLESPTWNQRNIIKIIKDKKINIFWTDKGHSNFKILNGKMYEVRHRNNTDALSLYENKKLVNSLVSEGIKQVALYSFNPKLTYRELDYIRKEKIKNKFGDKINIENVYVLETSPILNLYDKGFLSSGNEKDNFLGDISAYKYYGKLLGNILFDLFLQVPEVKQGLTNDEKRYNFFKVENRDFLRYYKLLNSDYYDFITNYPAKAGMTYILSKLSGFRLGLVSFHGNIFGKEEYLIDVPYKEYYQAYDYRLELNFNNQEKIGDLIATNKEDEIHHSERWLYFKYQKLSEFEFQYDYRLHPKLNKKDHLVELYLPLLHTGIFYEPNFYETDITKIKFHRVSKDVFDSKKECIEVIYLFRNEEFDGIKGISNLAFWRKKCDNINLIRSDIELFTEISWETVYRLIEAKFEATLVDLLQKESINQATRAAISQVMARNTSHNIGAHVMNKLTNPAFLEKFCSYANCLNSYKPETDFENSNVENHKPFNQLAIFNNYVKCRMDYLADISFGIPLMQTNKYVYGELFTEFDKVRLLLEHISGLGNFPYKIEFKRNGKVFQKDEKGNILDDLLVAIPNDILGTQAFYNILENIIRNTAKHSNKETLGDKQPVVFTVNFIDDIEKSVEHNKAINRDEIKNILTEFIAVEVNDNIPVVGDERELTKEEKDEYWDKMKKRDKDRFASKIDALVFNQNSKLNDDILSKENKIRSYSLGLVEMDASAAYLRKRPVEYINHKSYDIQYDEWWSRDTEVNEGDREKRGTNCRHFLKAFKKTEEVTDKYGIKQKEKNYLGYRFFLHRPAVVLVVTNELENDKIKRDKLQKEGIWVITPQKFEQDLKSGKAYPHEFVMHTDLKGYKIKIKYNEKEEVIELLKYFKTSLTLRVLEVTKDQLNSLFYTQDGAAEIQCNDKRITVKKRTLDIWEEFCWKKWQEEHMRLEYESNGMPKKDNKASDFYDHKLPTNRKLIESEYFYADALSSNAQKKLPLLNGKIADYYSSVLRVNPAVKLQVGESVCSRILVIDERIQENGRKIHQDIFPISFLYKMTGIIVPENTQVNLSANTMTPTLVKRIKVFIRQYAVACNAKKVGKKEFDKLNSDFDFILIHYSILERIFNSDKNDIIMFLKDLGTTNNVIITSGRGEPDGLPREVRFINLSSVIHALVETRSKYFINYILHQSRNSSKLKK